uniref:Chloride Channel (ClC) Family putative n=1 Tax=Albugo laibachii Nc14 TaxID=890382 RepID=F0WST7_9STRA|nr:Chloride Channel (ClC) Family putative [Albugo laibachii Nc14]|eukprot:CCA24415.1 Chloride Channel (ClC) Family putative [Albugo laibachii Nc14]
MADQCLERFPAQRRGEIVLETLKYPHLDRKEISQPGWSTPRYYQAQNRLQTSNSETLLGQRNKSEKTNAAKPVFIKAAAFDEEYHSVYVADNPKSWLSVLIILQSPLLLLAIGIFSALVGLFIDFWLAMISRYQQKLFEWGFTCFFVSALAAACLSAAVTFVCCPQSAGSGLPYMKVAISGVDMRPYLSWKCVLTKIVGLVAAFAAGLSIGKEGPFIMISCGFASNLLRWALFERVQYDETKRLEMLACACAVGVAATFGSPFGGVLFGVEVTSDFYLVRTLPRSFFASIVGALIVDFATTNARYGLFGKSNLGISDVEISHGFSAYDLGVFVMIGIVCGLGGALFNTCISMIVRRRDKFLNQQFYQNVGIDLATSSYFVAIGRFMRKSKFWQGLLKRLIIVSSITLISCISEFYGDPAWFIHHGAPHRILGALFSRTEKPFGRHGASISGIPLTDSGVQLSRSLLTYLPLKFVLTLLSVTLPLPAGLFTPTFVIGGIFGRLVGEAITAFDLLETEYEPFEYAIIGAGAFSSGVTHAISTAVIIMEISHTDSLNLPISLAILAAYFTSKQFTENVYDILIMTSNLPRLKKLPKAAYDIPAWEVMQDARAMEYLTADSTYEDASQVLASSDDAVFSIVNNKQDRLLLATVVRDQLENAVDYLRQNVARSLEWLGQEGSKSAPNLGSTLPSKTCSEIQEVKEDGVGTTRDTDVCIRPLHANCLRLPIHFALKRGGKIMDWGSNQVCERTGLTVMINPSPFHLMPMTTMRRVDLLFRMLKLNSVYVTRSGKLIGSITRDRLMHFLGQSREYRVPGLWYACWTSFSNLVDVRNESKPATKFNDYDRVSQYQV